MRLLPIYSSLYFALVLGAVLALWQAGILRRLPFLWTALVVLGAIGLGVVLVLSSSRQDRSTDAD